MVAYNLDGVDNVDRYTNVNHPFPFPDALQEFSVQTANYSAQYGGNAGGVVNVITKSGTNEFHGDAFGLLRNGESQRAQLLRRKSSIRSSAARKAARFGGPIRNGTRHSFSWAIKPPALRDVTNGLNKIGADGASGTSDFSALLNASDPNNP